MVIYIFPFFFLFHPALIFQGPILKTLYLFVLYVLGIILISAGLEGYLLRVGKMRLRERILIIMAGFMIAFPEGITGVIGAALAIFTVTIALIQKKKKVSQLQVA